MKDAFYYIAKTLLLSDVRSASILVEIVKIESTSPSQTNNVFEGTVNIVMTSMRDCLRSYLELKAEMDRFGVLREQRAELVEVIFDLTKTLTT